MKYWELLLIKWREQNRDGFTLPFIIGSQNYLKIKTYPQGIKELIHDVLKQENIQVSIRYCINIKDIVIEIRDERKIKNAGFFPKFNGHDQNKLFLTKFLKDLGDSVEDIIESLEERYNYRIEKKLFSKVNGEDAEYTSEEESFIRLTFLGYENHS